MAVSSRGVCDIRCQRFYTEMLQKENSIRMKWFLNNKERLLDNIEKGASTAEHEPSVCPRDRPQKLRSATHVRVKPMPPRRSRSPDESVVDINVMQPVHPEVKAHLFEKGIESSIATHNYFVERLKKSPEDRFYFPDCTSWVYGWRLKDYPPISPSKVGMKSVMQTEFFHPKVSSLQRDPEWYSACKPKNYNNLINLSLN